MSAEVLYFDLASPYAYLAVSRVASVLGRMPQLEPVLLGAIFKWRGSGSWSATSIRELRIAEIEARAKHYGLPPIVWPAAWPANALPAMRAATWAKAQGRTEEFAQAVYRAEFTRGADVSDVAVLARCAGQVGLDGSRLAAAIQCPAIKEQLRQATTAAWQGGVRGVPTLIVAETVFYGDDQLELAAAGRAP
ncbi:MAG TPA: DsbA family protein [Solirubrobacteraceae bacterium]